LQDVLGRGGMGVVYQAYDPLLKRTVALKRVARQAIPLPEDAALFRAEAQAAAQFDHRNIVTIHDVGEEAGEIYFTMTLIRGGTLSNWQRIWSDGSANPCPGGEFAWASGWWLPSLR
jgi:serine/threonine-protein kinase